MQITSLLIAGSPIKRHPMIKTLFHKWLGLMKKRLVLIVYFSLWFCALTFYNENALHLESSRVIGYGFAILQALMLSKLLLIPEGFLPFGVVFKPTVKGSLYLAIFIRTTIDSIIVLALRYLIVGLEGLLKGNGFIESTLAFYQGDIKHILAVLCLYWLIVLPYVVYRFLVYLAGEKDLEAFLLARNDQT
jgi:hypothetical protein